MATDPGPAPVSDTAILARLIRAEDDGLSAEAAEALLRIQFEKRDLDRIHELVTKNQDDRLSPAEQPELEIYL